MPKQQPITVDRIRISCEVVPEALGPVVVALTKMGLTNITHEIVTDVLNFRQKGGSDGRSAVTILTEWIADHATFKTGEAAEYLLTQGWAKTSAYPALKALVEKGLLKKLAGPNYSRSDVQAIAGPKTKPAKKKLERAAFTSGKSSVETILAYARRNHGRFSSVKLNEIFKEAGFHSNTIYRVCSDLIKRRLAKRVGEGEYVLLAKANPKPKPAKAIKLNGAAAPASEVSAHG